jgi:hypothetical protein
MVGLFWDDFLSFPLFIAIRGNYGTAKNAFWGKKDIMCHFQGVAESDFCFVF